MGTLLPLWEFVYEKEKKKQVTSISWSGKYRAMFAVSYGSYDFAKQGPGIICCLSLKNPSFPEFIFPTASGVMTVSFHPKVLFVVIFASFFIGSWIL